MGGGFSSHVSTVASKWIFPAPRCSYTWDCNRHIVAIKKNMSLQNQMQSCSRSCDQAPIVSMNIPAYYYQNDEQRISSKNCGSKSQQNIILYSHGNGEDIGHCMLWLKNLSDTLNIDVLAYDYDGYGLNSGTSSERACYDNIQDVFDFLLQKGYKEENILLYGRSLGTGPTVELARKYPRLKGIILESPFKSIIGVVSDTLAMSSRCLDPFNNQAKITQIQSPILIIHGTHDDIISHNHAEWLHSKCNCELLSLEFGGHNDLHFYYKDAIFDAINTQFLNFWTYT